MLEDGTRHAARRAPAIPRPALIDWLLHIENPLVWSSVMVRADAARRSIRSPIPSCLYAEDFDLYHRMARTAAIARLDEDLLLYRWHAGGASQRLHRHDGRERDARAGRRYAPLFGDEAGGRGADRRRIMMAQQPVPDRATLDGLGRR